MSLYTPDLWEIVRLNVEGKQMDKIFGSWYGGYAGSDEWRLSSGITKVVENDSHYEIHNQSGSVYTCYKNRQGMSRFAEGEFNYIKKKVEQAGDTLELLDITNILLK